MISKFKFKKGQIVHLDDVYEILGIIPSDVKSIKIDIKVKSKQTGWGWWPTRNSKNKKEK